MGIEEIYALVSQRMLQGSMLHEQLANYYEFLGLEGYKCCHEYHLREEFRKYREFICYAITQTSRLVPKQSVDSLTFNDIIPNNWYNFTRAEMDINTKRSSVKNAVEKWLHWEK